MAGKLNIGKINSLNDKLNESPSKLVTVSKLEVGDHDFRILPPSDKMEGVFYVERKGYWVKTTEGKRYLLSNKTFGKPCVIEEEVAKARAKKDRDLNALLADDDAFSENADFIIPVLFLEVKLTSDGDIVGFKIKHDEGRFLGVGKGLIKDINQIVTHRMVLPDITDRVMGTNILLQKTKVNDKVKYKPNQWTSRDEMPEKYYEQELCPIDWLMSENDSDAYKLSVIRNYLYGTPLIARKADVSAETPSRRTTMSADAPRRGAASHIEDPEEEEEPTAPVKGVDFKKKTADLKAKQAKKDPVDDAEPTPTTVARRVGSSILDDLDEDDA